MSGTLTEVFFEAQKFGILDPYFRNNGSHEIWKNGSAPCFNPVFLIFDHTNHIHEISWVSSEGGFDSSFSVNFPDRKNEENDGAMSKSILFRKKTLKKFYVVFLS